MTQTLKTYKPMIFSLFHILDICLTLSALWSVKLNVEFTSLTGLNYAWITALLHGQIECWLQLYYRVTLITAVLQGHNDYSSITGSHWIHSITLYYSPVRIRVRIDPPHPLVCRKRRLNGAVLRMRPENRGPMSQQVWHDRDPSLLNGHERRALA
jgi:hypothetical protein